ncbi:MAG: dUTP diphosphatase [Candidatus Pacebacteria bacterium]|nr:dUTP diphosphatase [Candidatus Paceibacterota bacterium]
MKNVEVVKLVPEARIPVRSHEMDAGLDLFAYVAQSIPPQGRAVVGTGIAVALPRGYAGLVWGRSGLAHRHGISVLAGVIDASYRGEWKVVLLNTEQVPFTIAPGDRVAQVLIQRVELCSFVEVAELPLGARSTGGFGSTGV